MAIIESINKARERGASDDQIIQEIISQNPAKKSNISTALSRGANSADIINEIVKQNTLEPVAEKKPLVGDKGTLIGGVAGRYLQRVGTGYKEATEKIGVSVLTGAEKIRKGEVAGGITRSGLGAAAGFGEAVYTPITAVVSPIVKPVVERIVSSKAFQESELPGIISGISQWANKNPEAAQNLSDIFSIGGAIAGAKAPGLQRPISEAGRPFVAAGKAVLRAAETPAERLGGLKTTLFGSPPKNVGEVITQADKALKPSEILAKTEAVTAVPSVKEKWVGISPDIKNRIYGKQDKLKEYFDVAHARNNLDTVPTPLEHAANSVENAVAKMDDVIEDTGSKIGSFRKKVATYEAGINQVSEVQTTFERELSKLNLKIVNGRVIQVPGKLSRVGSENDIRVLQSIYDEFGTFKENPNLEKLIDLRNIADSKINFAKESREVSNAIDPFARVVRKRLAEIGAKIVGRSEANNLKKYSDFLEAYNQLRSYTERRAGSEFLLKQVLSERGRMPRELMDAIKEYTGIDLMDDAVMASIATDLIGNTRQKGLFRQEITKAGLDTAALLRGDKRGAIEAMFNFLKGKIVPEEKTFLEAARIKKP